jgi:glutathione synthase/RimK-type ligase-like ATP-grasp enzyme
MMPRSIQDADIVRLVTSSGEPTGVDIVLATAAELPKPDRDSPLLVEALSELGLTAVVRPWDERADWGAARLVVSRTPWDYHLRANEFAAWARDVARRTRLENPVDVLLWNSHKAYLIDLERAGVPVVPTVLVRQDADDATRAAALRGHDEVVVKPAIGGGAVGALRAPAADPATNEHLRALTAYGEVLVQPFQPSVLRSGECSLIYFDANFSHAVRKLPAEGDYRVQDRHGGSVHAHDPTPRELAVAQATLAVAPSATSYARIDLIDGEAGPTVMEAELIEPELFLPDDPAAAGRFAQVLAQRVAG